MLTCVCRPVSGNLPKMPPTIIPAQKARPSSTTMVVVTAEPRINVPGRLTSAELRAMALRQQQQIDSQHQLLATKEQRLRFLKSQEVRNAVASAEGERLRRLRERVEAQESKLRRLRALRGQVDLQKTYNVTLSNDLDSIRALFSEKEKELSLAVAKVEALTRQLEDLRRDRRCPINKMGNTNAAAQSLPPPASRELEKLRRELMYRNQLTLQQDARLHLQREALQQRQAELRSVDQRIYELQTRLQRKKAANVQIVAQNQNQNHLLHAPSTHLLQQQQQQQQLQQQQHQQKQQQQHHQHQQQQPHQPQAYSADNTAFQTNLTKQGVEKLKQQLLQKQAGHLSQHGQQHIATKFSNIIASREQGRNIPRGNVAAVEPYIHTPQKSTITSTSSYLGGGNILKHSAATANTNLQNQLIQDLTHVKLNLAHTNSVGNHLSAANANTNATQFFNSESDESKLAKKMLSASIAAKSADAPKKPPETDTSHHIYAEVGPKKRDLLKQAASNQEAPPSNASNTNTSTAPSTNQGSKIPKSIISTSSASALINKLNSVAAAAAAANQNPPITVSKEKSEKKTELPVPSETHAERNKQQLTVHSMPLGTANKSIATPVAQTTTTTSATGTTQVEPTAPPTKSKSASSSNLAVPPRKPISSVAPTSVTSSIPKMITYSPKVNRVAPSILTSSSGFTVPTLSSTNATDRPALPPKPSKMSPTESSTQEDATSNSSSTITSTTRKSSPDIQTTASFNLQTHNINDNLPIKPKPLTIRKQPMCEQPRLKSNSNVPKPPLQPARKMDMPSSYLYQEGTKNASTEVSNENMSYSPEQLSQQSSPTTQQQQQQQQQQQHSPPTTNNCNSQSNSSVDETDKMDNNNSTDKSPDSLKRRMRSCQATNSSNGGKPKLTRRVSFDPLALLLDASLEGELELVKKTAMQVANPSAANDEGITALHNAICAGHFDIVKFLVEFGCDVNAQDSDGWTPLHCAASCNNLAMVKFLVENGACLFAATLSDHETPAAKCEEDEEGFDGCSEYLYSIQEKLGILHNGEVYAVFSYEAQNNDELTFNINDRLIILRKGDDAESEWWWAKNAKDEEGYVPRNLFGLYPRVTPQTPNFND